MGEKAASLEQKVEKLQADVDQLKKKRRDVWDKFQTLSPFLTAVVVAVLGYALNRTINDALQEQQLVLANVREMREALLRLGAETDSAQATRTALTLAAFGRHAIAPLVSVLDTGQDVLPAAAEEGLRAVGLNDRRAACQRMNDLVGNRRGVYRWTTHRVAVRLIGDLGCPGVGDDLRQFSRLVDARNTPEGAVRFRSAFREGKRWDQAELALAGTELHDEIERTLDRLEVEAARP